MAENLDLIHRGDTEIVFATHTYGQLTAGLGHYDHVIIDTHNAAYAWTLHVDRRLLVTRPCYLALRRSAITPRPDAVVLINEHERALNATDIETVLGIPITATVPYHPPYPGQLTPDCSPAESPENSPAPSALSSPPRPDDEHPFHLEPDDNGLITVTAAYTPSDYIHDPESAYVR